MIRYVNIYGTYLAREGHIVKRIRKGGIAQEMFRDNMKNEYPIYKTKLPEEMTEKDWSKTKAFERSINKTDKALKRAKDKLK